MTLVNKAILKTLIYADIFDYPLTLYQIKKYLIWQSSSLPPNFKQIKTTLQTTPYFQKTNRFYHLKNRQSIVKIRQKRFCFSQSKHSLALKYARFLAHIPGIRLIALTGSLAMNNSPQNDDLDFLIVTSQNRLWLIRLLAVFLFELLGVRRRPGKRSDLYERQGRTLMDRNKICLNLFLDETALKIPPKKQNLYTAHELAQLKPLINRRQTYQKLIQANPWVKNYLPHAFPFNQYSAPERKVEKGWTLTDKLNFLAFKLQYLYMRKKITREKVSLHAAFFHPQKTAKIILTKYHQKIKKL